MEANELSTYIRGTGKRAAQSGTALSVAKVGEKNIVQDVSGKEDVRRLLGNLGFIEGQKVIVIKECGGDIIVEVLGSRVAIGKSQARRITVRPEEAAI